MIIETTNLLLRALTPDPKASKSPVFRPIHNLGRQGVALDVAADRQQMPVGLHGKTFVATFALPAPRSWAGPPSPPTPCRGALFTVVEKSSEMSIGGIVFESSPNERGEVEIGYGISESFQGRGVATEAVLALCELARRGARAVIAETDIENVASQRVLEKSGFRIEAQGVALIRWRRDLPDAES